MSTQLREQWLLVEDALTQLERLGWRVVRVLLSTSQKRPLLAVERSGKGDLPTGSEIKTTRRVRSDGRASNYLETTIGGCRVEWRAD